MSEHKMQGAELASKLKGQLGSGMGFNGLLGVDAEDLHLSEEEIRWWRDAKLGLFVHWGVFSAIGKGEWAYFNEKIPEEEYRQAAESFCPKRGPEEITGEWLDLAQEAGLKYAVMVTRHHDGFALWDSPASWKDFTSMRCGPKADYVKAFTQGCRQRGIHTGLYYSPMDWRFPGYFDPKGQPESAARMKEQGYRQVEELCTRYGRVEILWYDAAWFWEPLALNRMARSHQPGIMTTPRSGYKGDFETDEGPHGVKGKIVPIPWEKCVSVSTAWGYREEDTFFDFPFLLRMLVDTVCRDGNLLLNVGPDPEGRVPEEARAPLVELGQWLEENGQAVYGTRGGPWQPVDEVFGCTYTDSAIYLHILDARAFEGTVLSPDGLPEGLEVRSAALLDGTPVELIQSAEGLRVILPPEIRGQNRLDTVVKLTRG